MASRRDGGADRRQAVLAVTCAAFIWRGQSGTRSFGSPRAGPAQEKPGPKTQTSRSDDANARYSGSNHRDQLSSFCPLMLPSTLCSIFNAIRSPERQREAFDAKLTIHNGGDLRPLL